MNFDRRRAACVWIVFAGLLALSPKLQAQKIANPSSDTQQTASGERFEVASIRPSHPDPEHISMSNSDSARFIEHHYPLTILICMAYGISSDHLHTPGWMDGLYYDIEAKAEGDAPRTPKQFNVMLRQLLEERFHMKAHHVTAYQSGYTLIVAKGGPKLKAVDLHIAESEKSNFYILPGALHMPDSSLDSLAKILAHMLGRPVVNKTGIEGNYQFNFEFAPMNDEAPTKPSLVTALEEQFGLRLASEKNLPVDELVVDSADRTPTEN
jgi:uncharacterized protein (TIGR03435 family)